MGAAVREGGFAQAIPPPVPSCERVSVSSCFSLILAQPSLRLAVCSAARRASSGQLGHSRFSHRCHSVHFCSLPTPCSRCAFGFVLTSQVGCWLGSVQACLLVAFMVISHQCLDGCLFPGSCVGTTGPQPACCRTAPRGPTPSVPLRGGCSVHSCAHALWLTLTRAFIVKPSH